jgi:hypothetical protein
MKRHPKPHLDRFSEALRWSTRKRWPAKQSLPPASPGTTRTIGRRCRESNNAPKLSSKPLQA